MNQFLIPANSKKSMLIFSIFTPFDLILFICGVTATILMLIIIPLDGIFSAIMALAPLLISALLVFPVAHYHNVLTVLLCIYKFYTTNKEFIWKGWCVSSGTENDKTNGK